MSLLNSFGVHFCEVKSSRRGGRRAGGGARALPAAASNVPFLHLRREVRRLGLRRGAAERQLPGARQERSRN